MSTYTKEYIEDLKEIIENEGDCENIPCYPGDCPIYFLCEGVDSLTTEQRKRIATKHLKSIPKKDLFDALL